MKLWNAMLGVVLIPSALALGQVAPQPPTGYQAPNPGNPPVVAFDITKADLDAVLKNPAPHSSDQPVRVVDVGKYNMEIGVVHRDISKDKPGDPIMVAYHDLTAETYIILSGSGTLTTGGDIDNKKLRPGQNIVNGPGGDGTAGKGAYSRKVHAGDIIVIPPGVAHGWSQITEPLTYISVRPDPDRVLPGGYVNPLLLKNPPQDAK